MKRLHILAVFLFWPISLPNILLAGELQKLPGDTEIRQKIVGTWVVDIPPIKGTVTIISGGRFVSQAAISLANNTQEIRYEGAWQIDGGILIEEIKKSDSKLVPVGLVSRDKIIRLNDQELVYLTEKGKTVTRERSK